MRMRGPRTAGAVIFESLAMAISIFSSNTSTAERPNDRGDAAGRGAGATGAGRPHRVVCAPSGRYEEQGISIDARADGGWILKPVPIGGMLDEFRCAVGGKRCVLRTTVAGQYFAYHELDPVRGKGRELARTPWIRNILAISGAFLRDGTQVALPNHYSRNARIRVVSLEPELDSTRRARIDPAGLSDLKGVIWAADGSGWFVVSETDIGERMFFVLPDGRYHPLGDIQGWAGPFPHGSRERSGSVLRRATRGCWTVFDRHRPKLLRGLRTGPSRSQRAGSRPMIRRLPVAPPRPAPPWSRRLCVRDSADAGNAFGRVSPVKRKRHASMRGPFSDRVPVQRLALNYT